MIALNEQHGHSLTTSSHITRCAVSSCDKGGSYEGWECPVHHDGHRPTDFSHKPVPPPARDAIGPRRFRSTPTMRDGIRFASKGEAALWDKAKATGAVVIPHVRFPLHVLTTEGQSATWFSPDLVVMMAGGDYDDETTMHNVEAWEFKGPRATESRDYALRARSFRATYPTIPLRVFRRVKGELVEDPALSRAAGGAS